MSPEELETHNPIKTEVLRVLANLNVEQDLGKLYSDRTSIANDTAGLATEADGTFVSWKSLESKRVGLVPRSGKRKGYVQLNGSPDWVLEVVSTWSVQKDTRDLRKKYHLANVKEYWLIDALGDDIEFKILRHRPRGYVAAPSRDGWQRSPVFDRSFRLERRRDRLGLWQYSLLMALS